MSNIQNKETQSLRNVTDLATLHTFLADHLPFTEVKHAITNCNESQVNRDDEDKSLISSADRR